jgi:pre-rRNA-processing protein RIX1
LFVLLHLTVAKNAGGDDWGKAVRDLVKETHLTADQVFRAVIEDWESTVGYIGVAVDVNQELARASTTTVDLPHWSGIDAGIERLVGLLSMLSEYFKNETSSPVSIPLGSIVDMITRMLSIPIPIEMSVTDYGVACPRYMLLH